MSFCREMGWTVHDYETAPADTVLRWQRMLTMEQEARAVVTRRRQGRLDG